MQNMAKYLLIMPFVLILSQPGPNLAQIIAPRPHRTILITFFNSNPVFPKKNW